jgi:hypothetical protein
MVRSFQLKLSSFAFLLADDDGLSANRIVLRSVFNHCGDDILSERVYTSKSRKDPPSVIPDVSGGHYGASTSYQTRSFDQVPILLSRLASFHHLVPGSAGVHRS